jgi:hypothetical protein
MHNINNIVTVPKTTNNQTKKMMHWKKWLLVPLSLESLMSMSGVLLKGLITKDEKKKMLLVIFHLVRFDG